MEIVLLQIKDFKLKHLFVKSYKVRKQFGVRKQDTDKKQFFVCNVDYEIPMNNLA